jgi:hypothetical protein
MLMSELHAQGTDALHTPQCEGLKIIVNNWYRMILSLAEHINMLWHIVAGT